MLSTQAILEDASESGSLDLAEWPRVLESLLQKLHDIVHNDFPLPSIPRPVSLPPTIDPEVVASTPPRAPNSDHDHSAEDLPDAGENENEPPVNSQSSSKENDEPTDIAAARPPVPGFEVNHAHQPVQPPDSIETQAGTLPPDLLSLYQSSTRILEHDFSQSPPYTIQRLAELVLHPKRHYRFLPAYLRALDRIVSVSSPISDFPLPMLQRPVNGGFLTNGDSSQVNGITERESLGSDESLGGALLTPIPWLRTNNTALTGNTAANGHDGELHSESTETIEGPNGAGSIETVSVTVNGVPSASSVAHTSPTPASPTLSEQSDASSSSSAESIDAQLRQQGGVTQGELLRQEQEAGLIPVSQASPRRSLLSGGAAALGRESAMNDVPRDTAADVLMQDSRPPEETPHARGPQEIGMEDMGPQHHSLGAGSGLDLEAAVGRSKSPLPEHAPRPAQVGSPPPVTTQQQMDEVPSAPVAEADAKAAEQDDAGAPGKDPRDVEMEVEKAKEATNEETHAEVKDADGDIVVADADGRPAEKAE
ncbi:hypothetical protein LTR36_010382 [Oleoguttula mirabilis]|uniref:Protein phosphatase 4 core regulatory subunit R2 n=1 Tax=Oleoguttula mirabilis TaxID=1507867 RepID=A0AAV9J4M5_9PEZI|nr:hypothetical protein LTR36_010382 [Oleoguttula mirabilis]